MSGLQSNASASCCWLKRKRPPKIEIPTVLQEIEIQPHKLELATPPTDTVSSAGNDHVGVFSVKGKKRFMEDTHKIIPCLEGHLNDAFFGVYDGHGGRKAANFVAQNLHNNILDVVGNCTRSAEKEEAIKAAFLKTDRDFLDLGLGSGVCCVTVLIQGEEVIVSNLGDCRAVLSRGGVAEAITKDHRVEHEDERKRIENKGGYVEIHKGAWRVHGILSVSRSIGDAHLKDWVLAEPDSKVLLLSEDMEFLVLATDGLWEKVGNQETVDVVTRLRLMDKNFGLSKGFVRSMSRAHCSVNTSPSKLRRVSLVVQQKGVGKSPICEKSIDGCEEGEYDYSCEIESPGSKSRRISLVRHMKMKTESSPKENNGCYRKRPTSSRLVAACKELVDLALSRGSLDDITVMIIDLSHFRCKSQSESSCNL
ncbi:probable protein phosphatase 2C 14 isoform X2 [Momordica charantia]|uniref:protein-serine/threonine phosphatase n=1 Tax=Momordica charantia TaxID=3673 RepID=A0A6J1BRW6_MOMCH|nr:probable protein phosphatase 2C 14 isoform X2 [Momordica charantia]